MEEIKKTPEHYDLIDLNKVQWLAPNPETRKIIGVAFNNKGIRKEAIYRHLANFHGVEPESVKRELMRRRKKVTKK